MKTAKSLLIAALCAILLASLTPLVSAPAKPEKKAVPGKLSPMEERAKRRAEIRRLRAEIKRLRLIHSKLAAEERLARTRLNRKLRKIKEETAVLRAKNALFREKMRRDNARARQESNARRAELARIRLTMSRMNLRKGRLLAEAAMIRARIRKRTAQRIYRSEVNYKPVYLNNPYRNGKLIISDRRIKLNGPIYYKMSDAIVERIHFYNNKSTRHPIFIVIDRSPGGSVIAGYRILTAMKASRAPIHVVVKSYAASMAAVILTLADHSYALPNAVILHHQVSSYTRGNITQQRERLAISEEWMRRLATPVAKKMGIGLKQFVKRMYANSSDGDWREFAEKAQQLKWVNHVITNIEERGVHRLPRPVRRFRLRFTRRRRYEAAAARGNFVERRDRRGNRYVELPPLQPFDVYFMYDPSRYYR